MKLTLTVTLAIASFLLAQGRGPDGHYHNPDTGEVQPDVCDTLPGQAHPCECLHARPKCDGTDTKEYVGKKCMTWCCPSACRCDTCCPTPAK